MPTAATTYRMSRIRSKNTAPERALRSALHRRGLRFRIHATAITGRPDIVFAAARIVVFVDGSFWHGYRFASWRSKLSEYWQQKIERNMQRDRRTRRRLRAQGWTVVRAWEHDVRRNVNEAADAVERTVRIGARRG